MLDAVAVRLAAFDLVETAMFVRKMDQATGGGSKRARGGAAARAGTETAASPRRAPDPGRGGGEGAAAGGHPPALDLDWLKDLKKVAKKAFVAKAEKES